MHPSLWCTKMFWSFPKLEILFFWIKYHNFMVTNKNKYFNQNTLSTMREMFFLKLALTKNVLFLFQSFFFFNHVCQTSICRDLAKSLFFHHKVYSRHTRCPVMTTIYSHHHHQSCRALLNQNVILATAV